MRLLSNATMRGIKSRTRDAVIQWFPTEAPFFEHLWSLFEMVLEEPLDNIGPEDFQVCTVDETLATELGFPQEANLWINAKNSPLSISM